MRVHVHTHTQSTIPVSHWYLGLPVVEGATDIDFIPSPIPPKHYRDGPLLCTKQTKEQTNMASLGEEAHN